MNCIIVDIQPAYDKYCRHMMPELCNYINNQNPGDEVLILYNGEDIGLDTKESIQNYYLDYGISEDKVYNSNSNVIWRDKIYGYFRDIMDSHNVGEDIIIQIIKEMIKSNVIDSRDLPQEYKERLYADNDIIINDVNNVITLPDIEEVHKYSICNVMGGGRDECLKEIELYLGALDIKFNRINRFIY